MTKYNITLDNIETVIQTLGEEIDLILDSGKQVSVEVKPLVKTRSLSQNALQHVIYTDVSKYLVKRGRIDWTPLYTKKQLKNKFLGWVSEVYVDIKTGEKTVREVLKSTAGLDKGDAHQYTTQIIEWSESIGCEIKIPAKCEYRDLMNQQCE